MASEISVLGHAVATSPPSGVKPLANPSRSSGEADPETVRYVVGAQERPAYDWMIWDRVVVIAALSLIGFLVVLEIVQIVASR